MNEYWFYYGALFFFFAASFCYFGYLLTKNEIIGKMGTVSSAIGLISIFIALVMRTVISGHAPFSNMYEYSNSFAFGIVATYLFAEYRYNLKVLGAFVLPTALIVAVSTIMLGMSLEATPLMPALQSNWLTAHVATAIIAYAAYAVSFGLAIMYFIKDSLVKAKSKSFFNQQLPDKEWLDEVSYRFIVFAFPFMSLVIITGAIWAEFAWGRYWSWDPKETWSLITWLVYAAYLHARFTFGWKGHRAAWLAIIGFGTVIFTYYGVNILLSGLHSYGAS